MRAIGVVDGMEVIDPESGEPKWVNTTAGLQFSYCDPVNPAARVRGRLAVRAGGMLVFEALGTMEGVEGYGGASGAITAATNHDIPPTEDVEAELRAQGRSQAPRKRQPTASNVS